MLKFTEIELTTLDNLVRHFRRKIKPSFSNYFGLIQNFPVSIFSDTHNFLICQKHSSFSRIYFLSDSLTALREAFKALEGDVFILNYVNKEVNRDLVNSILNSGFVQLSQYKRYYNVKIREGLEILNKIEVPISRYLDNGYKIAERPKPTDSMSLFNMINSDFSEYTDYNPSLKEIGLMIEENRIFINRDPDNKISGYFIFKDTGIKRYQNFWFDKNGMGLSLMRRNYEDMLEKNIPYTNFWADAKNKQVIRLHSILGAVYDGMNDITFIKQ